MRIGVLGSADSWYYRDLRRAAREADVSLAAAAFSRIAVRLHQPVDEPPTVQSAGTRLHEFDALIVRTMPPGSLEQVVFRMDALASLETSGVAIINRPKAIEAAVDKFLTTARLVQAGLPTPPTSVCQDYDEAMNAFEAFQGDVVVKPLFGGEGRGILRLQDKALAHRTFRTLEQLNAVIYLQPFLAHEGSDLRLLRIGDRVFGMRRRNPLDWRSNISQGGRAETLEVDDELRRLALNAADAVGAEFAGVDVLPAKDGNQYVLEVNAVPGWRALQRVVSEDIAACLLRHVQLRAAAGAPDA